MRRGTLVALAGRIPGLVALLRRLRDRRAEAALAGIDYRPGLCINSMPKAGTHLLAGALAALEVPHYRRHLNGVDAATLARLDGAVFFTHLAYSPEAAQRLQQAGYHQWLLLRAPTAVALSTLVYVLTRRDHPQHAAYAQAWQQGGAQALVALRVHGDAARGLGSIAALYRRYFDWAGQPGVAPLYYEDLTGPQGLSMLLARLAEEGAPLRTPDVTDLRALAPPQASATVLPDWVDRRALQDLLTGEHAAILQPLERAYQRLRESGSA